MHYWRNHPAGNARSKGQWRQGPLTEFDSESPLMEKLRGCRLCEDRRFHGKPAGLLPLLKAHSSPLPRDRSQSLKRGLPNPAVPTAVASPGPAALQAPAVSESEEHKLCLPCARDSALPGPSPPSPLPAFPGILLLLKASLSPQPPELETHSCLKAPSPAETCEPSGHVTAKLLLASPSLRLSRSLSVSLRDCELLFLCLQNEHHVRA